MPQSAVELLREAMAAARVNDKPRTRELLLKATTLEPSNETAWQWLGGVAETPIDAVNAYERVLSLNPFNDKARVSLRNIRIQAAISAARSKDITTARRLLRAHVADDPANEQGWIWLAGVAENPSEALVHLNKALELNPNNTAAKKGIEYYQNKLRKAGVHDAGKMSGASGIISPNSGHIPVLEQTPPPNPTPIKDEPIAPGSRVVLAIDPSRTVRKIIGLTLAEDGYQVTEAADGLEAVERIREDGAPAVIIVSTNLPGLDGYEFCRLVRQHPDTKSLPLIAMTERDGLVDKWRGKWSGADQYLAKPLKTAAIRAAVQSVQTQPASQP